MIRAEGHGFIDVRSAQQNWDNAVDILSKEIVDSLASCWEVWFLI